MESLLRRFWGYALEILFPQICLVCKKHLSLEREKNNRVCENCFLGIPIYKTVSWNPNFTLAAVSSYENEAVKEIIHAFKYKRFLGLSNAIAKLIDMYLPYVDLRNVIGKDAVIVPIPLHVRRLRERGFNQAEEIANILAERLSLPVITGAVIKTSNTPHQISLKTKEERAKNVLNSFKISNKDAFLNKTVLLVDDVYTSGSTIREVAKLFKRVGVKNVFGFVIAKTI